MLFYSAVFPFLKYATELMIQKFHVAPELRVRSRPCCPSATSCLRRCWQHLRPQGTRRDIMLIGSALLVIVHVLFVPTLTSSWLAVALIRAGCRVLAGPSAMWPSLAKIVPTGWALLPR
ncbi:MAG: hypothetical protein ACLT1W_14835 [Alistipes onderdonkii]